MHPLTPPTLTLTHVSNARASTPMPVPLPTPIGCRARRLSPTPPGRVGRASPRAALSHRAHVQARGAPRRRHLRHPHEGVRQAGQ
eukprot:6961117-Prymnesium_polylepis.1